MHTTTLDDSFFGFNDVIMAPLNSYKFLVSALVAAGIALFTGQACAITILNPSFELPGGATTTCPVNWVCPTFSGGEYAPTSTQYVSGSDGLTSPNRIVPAGSQVAFMARGTANQIMTQDTTATFETGKKYTLTVYAGLRNDFANTGAGGGGGGTTWGPNVFIELLANGVAAPAMIFTVPNPGTGQWALETLTYTAVAADNGKTIGVGLLADTNGGRVQINWDDVRLAPEPTTLLLLAMGFGSFALVRRKKKNPA